MFTLGAFGIIFDGEGRVLLCHRRDYDLWNLPGGRVERGEAPWQACIREVEEEVGLQVEIERLSGVYYVPARDEIVFAFVCAVVAGEATTTDEADRVEYFPLEGLPRNMPPKHVERIKDALEARSETVLKAQTGPSAITLLKEGKLG